MDRRSMLRAGLTVPAVSLVGTALASPADARPRITGVLARGLDYPWGISFLPSGSALVTERNSGRVLAVSRHGGYRVVGSVPGTFNAPGGEGGLMGVAVSPPYRRDRWVYFFLTTTSDNRIVRMRYDGRRL